jgi:isocitrate dehydrogenase
LATFSETLEQSIIDTIEAGGMTKDLALLTKQKDYLSTEGFIDAVNARLQAQINITKK